MTFFLSLSVSIWLDAERSKKVVEFSDFFIFFYKEDFDKALFPSIKEAEQLLQTVSRFPGKRLFVLSRKMPLIVMLKKKKKVPFRKANLPIW